MIVPLPPVITTSAFPIVPAGVTAVTVVAFTAVTLLHGAPPMVTPVVSARNAPVIVICEPPAVEPAFGAIELTEAGM